MTIDALQDEQGIMPLDLAPSAVTEHWRSLGLDRAIHAMEACEPWVIDPPGKGNADAEQIIAELTSRLQLARPEGVSLTVARAPGHVIDLMGYLRSGRALLLFKWLTELHPSIASALINEARHSGDDFGVVLLDRINVLQKQHLLYRVFSPERMALVMQVLEAADLTSEEGEVS